MILICSGVKVACGPVVSLADHFYRSEIHRDSKVRRNDFLTTQRGNYCFLHPLVKKYVINAAGLRLHKKVFGD